MSDDANSGIFIRCQDPKNITATNAYEVNIYDKRPDQAYRTGGIVDVAKPMAMINTGGKWNTFDITAQGTKLIVVLNGTKSVDLDHKGHVRGPSHAVRRELDDGEVQECEDQDAIGPIRVARCR